MSDLRSLAETYVRLETELEDTRRAMLAALTNGSAPGNPTPARRRGPPPSYTHPAAARAAEVEGQIVALLNANPGMGTAAIASATSSRTNTTAERLRRMRTKGVIRGGGSEGWVATATP
jgi:hypothetical protein